MNASPAPEGWKQSFPFSCGPAALGAVLVALGSRPPRDRVREELELWRESTAVVCPGAHPFGLALAATRRGFSSGVWIVGPSPWLWSHIRSDHGFSRIRDYVSVERSLSRQCVAAGIALHRTHPRASTKDAGLLLTTAPGRRTDDRDPHWIALVPTSGGLWVVDPLRRAAYRSYRSHRDWWETSGFDGTRTWVTVGRRSTSSMPGTGDRSQPTLATRITPYHP